MYITKPPRLVNPVPFVFWRKVAMKRVLKMSSVVLLAISGSFAWIMVDDWPNKMYFVVLLLLTAGHLMVKWETEHLYGEARKQVGLMEASFLTIAYVFMCIGSLAFFSSAVLTGGSSDAFRLGMAIASTGANVWLTVRTLRPVRPPLKTPAAH